MNHSHEMSQCGSFISVNKDAKNRLLTVFSVLYLVIPLLFFTYGWLRQPASGIVFVILFVFFIFIFLDLKPSLSQIYFKYKTSTRAQVFRASLLKFSIGIVVLFIWLFFSGIGGFGYQTMDYLHHNALFKSLIESPWPLTTEWNGQIEPVVYYLGWYLPAAFFGRLYGWGPANVFLLVWALIGVMLSFGWFLYLCAIRNLTIIKLLVILAVFCFAGGLDFIGYYVLRGHPFDIHNLFPLDGWSFLQYSSNTTLIYWVPQHVIPAWLITGLVVESILGRLTNIKYLGISLTGSLLSSSFSVMGILPYLLVLLAVVWRNKQWRQLLTRQNIVLNILAIPIAAVVFLYISSNKISFPVGFIWEFTDSPLVFVGWLEFFMMEIGLLSLFVFMGLWSDKSVSSRKLNSNHNESFGTYIEMGHGISTMQFMLFIVSVAVLLFLPAYKMGYADDFVMRASIPALFIFWSFISKILTDSGLSKNAELRTYYVAIVCLVVIGFYNSLAQISVSVRDDHFGPPDEDTVLTVATGSLPWIVEQRIGSRDTLFYEYLGK